MKRFWSVLFWSVIAAAFIGPGTVTTAAAAGAFAVAVPAAHSATHDFASASLVIENLADPRLYEVLGIEG